MSIYPGVGWQGIAFHVASVLAVVTLGAWAQARGRGNAIAVAIALVVGLALGAVWAPPGNVAERWTLLGNVVWLVLPVLGTGLFLLATGRWSARARVPVALLVGAILAPLSPWAGLLLVCASGDCL